MSNKPNDKLEKTSQFTIFHSETGCASYLAVARFSTSLAFTVTGDECWKRLEVDLLGAAF
jgi:hypothetical protein